MLDPHSTPPHAFNEKLVNAGRIGGDRRALKVLDKRCRRSSMPVCPGIRMTSHPFEERKFCRKQRARQASSAQDVTTFTDLGSRHAKVLHRLVAPLSAAWLRPLRTCCERREHSRPAFCGRWHPAPSPARRPGRTDGPTVGPPRFSRPCACLQFDERSVRWPESLGSNQVCVLPDTGARDLGDRLPIVPCSALYRVWAAIRAAHMLWPSWRPILPFAFAIFGAVPELMRRRTPTCGAVHCCLEPSAILRQSARACSLGRLSGEHCNTSRRSAARCDLRCLQGVRATLRQPRSHSRLNRWGVVSQHCMRRQVLYGWNKEMADRIRTFKDCSRA